MEGETGHAGQHRAVVWHAPDAAPPPNLMSALAGRGIEAVRVQSPYRALAELCRGGASPSIVIVHPERMPDAVAFWAAKSRYAPGARCWMYGPMAKPVLRAIVEADIAGWGGQREPEIVVRPQPKAEGDSLRIGPRREPPRPRPATPQLKLTGEPLPARAEEQAEDTPRAPLLSPEELRMLLGDDEPGAAEKR